MGRSEAGDYASTNEAQLTSYCYTPSSDRVRVKVQMNDPVSSETGPARAEAQASVGFRPISCTWDDDAAPEPPDPPDEPPPADDDEEEPEPEPYDWPDTFTTLDCGYFTATFRFDLADCFGDGTADAADLPDLATCARDLVGDVEVNEDAFSVRLEN